MAAGLCVEYFEMNLIALIVFDLVVIAVLRKLLKARIDCIMRKELRFQMTYKVLLIVLVTDVFYE